MKLALVCDDLIQHGGAEKILEAVSDMFPDAPIYTTVASADWRKKFESKKRKIVTSFLQKFPFAVKLNRFYSTLYLHVLAIESFDFSDYDLVFSLSSRYAHFALTKPRTKHLCYLHTPGRMFWEPFDYFRHELSTVPPFLKAVIMFLLQPFLSWMRIADRAAMWRLDAIISNSETTKNRLFKYFGRESEVIHPFVETPAKTAGIDGGYYVVLSRLVPWKKMEIAIEACKKLNKKLKIIGAGPDEKRLKSLADENIEFLGAVDENTKWQVLSHCRALIVTQKEDFGIVPLEAMSVGKTVIAFGEGGVLETVSENETGIFFDEQTAESLSDSIKKFEKMKFGSEKCRVRSAMFSKDAFRCSILKRIDGLLCTDSLKD